jgi:hypothetical protein
MKIVSRRMEETMSVASSLEYICHHEPQKPAEFAAAAIPRLTRQVIAKATKARAGSNTSQASPDTSAVMVRNGMLSGGVY